MRSAIDAGTVLITGASSGVGRELARQLARRARTLVLVARSAQSLEALRDELLADNPTLGVVVEGCDLSQPEQVDALLDSLQRDLIRVDVLVNSAGLGEPGLYEQEHWSRIHQQLQTNLVAPLHLTHRLVQRMVRRRWGGLIHIAPEGPRGFAPGLAVTEATRRFLDGFTESLRLELLGTGVVVTQVEPGPMDSAQAPAWLRISAAQCAREAIAGFDLARPLVRPGLASRWMTRLAALLPRGVERAMRLGTARRLRHGPSPLEHGAGESTAPSPLLAGG